MSNKLVKNEGNKKKSSNNSNNAKVSDADIKKNVIIGCAVLAVVVVIILIAGIVSSVTKNNNKNSIAERNKQFSTSGWSANKEIQDIIDSGEYVTGKHNICISVAGYGEIEVELDGDTAPITVTNFLKLANSEFYNGLTFHRIISGFMIQGGDPDHDGTGGSKETIRGEFSINNVKNDISHKRGVISMARSMDNDSASSQFFIVHEDSEHLDGQYAGFGMVTKGMEVVDKIASEAVVEDNNGTVLYENQPIINYIKVID